MFKFLRSLFTRKPATMTLTLPNGVKVEGIRVLKYRKGMVPNRIGNARRTFAARPVQGNAIKAA
jgi:hypothetical protein